MLRCARRLPILVLLACLAQVAEAHVPPPAYCKMAVTDTEVRFELVASFKVFRDWFGIDPEQLPADGPLPPQQRTVLQTKMEEWLRVQVDGAVVEGVLAELVIERFEDHLQHWQFVHVPMSFALATPPQRVSFLWSNYDTGTDYYFYELDAELDAFEESYYPLFRTGEPEFTWHRPRVKKQPPPALLPPPLEPPHVMLPLLSLALMLALLVGAFLWPGRTTPQRLVLALTAGAALAAPLLGVRARVPLPGDAQLERPRDEDAVVVFAALHRGIYTALDGEDENEIYDRLAESVSGPLLETLYLDINESMILHDEGGVVAKVKRAEVLESEVLPDREAGAPWFRVKARWRVEGKVGHYAHTHQRINEYLANVTIVAANGEWRIAEIEVLDETRATTSSQDR